MTTKSFSILITVLFFTNFVFVYSQNQLQQQHPRKQSKLNCDETGCSLVIVQENGEEKVAPVKALHCSEDECIVSASGQFFTCKHISKQNEICEKRPYSLIDILINSDNNNDSDENDENDADLEEKKRGLPFETLNYGRKKKMLPFETLNYGKRYYQSFNYGHKYADRRSQLPFEPLQYGKRMLPFETLNYGKRSQIPFEGYILGRDAADE